jgi:hypothetical protein
MPSKNNHESEAKPQDLKQSGAQRIESIEELLRARGFFDSVKPENKG